MEHAPQVSIIIACFNRYDRTEECWKALRLTVPASLPCETIFIDNASSDETPAFLANIEKTGAARVITNAANLGFAAACNQGAEIARGKFLLFLNNDTVPQQGWIEPLLELAERDETVGAVGSKLIYPDGRIQHAGVVVKDRASTARPLWCSHIHRHSRHDAPWVNVEREYQAVTGACLLTRREIFARLSGFDEAFRNGYEDVDYCFRVRAEGLRVVYCPRSMLIHHESSSQGRFSREDGNARLFSERWSALIEADESAIYAEAVRPDIDAVSNELRIAREALAKFTPLMAKPMARGWKANLRRALLRWLGLERTLRQLTDNLRVLHRATEHLRRVTEANALLLDYQQFHSPPQPEAPAADSRADSVLH
ncbi:MAG: glycosyltransferase family 2 protein [Verrucomicrobiota bacterium]|nr:glycosyltransferase family 2 protein [Verrucomicrobiota bacterium]